MAGRSWTWPGRSRTRMGPRTAPTLVPLQLLSARTPAAPDLGQPGAVVGSRSEQRGETPAPARVDLPGLARRRVRRRGQERAPVAVARLRSPLGMRRRRPMDEDIGTRDCRRRTRDGERRDLGDHHPPPPSGPGRGRLPSRGPERRRLARDDRLATAHRRGRRHRAIAAAGATQTAIPLRVQLRGGGGDRPPGPVYGPSPRGSGHNSYSDWGIPPDGAGPVVVIGYTERGYVARALDGL